MFSTLVIMYQIIPLSQIFIPLLQENVTCYSKTEYRFGISTFDLIKITISGRCFFSKVKICCTVLLINYLPRLNDATHHAPSPLI